MCVSLSISKIFLLLCATYIVYCDIFSSISDLERSVNRFKGNSEELKRTLKNFVYKQMDRLERAEKYLQTIKEVTGDELKDPEFKITHPLNAYRFIRNQSEVAAPALSKLVEELQGFENDTQKTLNSNFTLMLLRNLPKSEDLSGSVASLVRLQHVYKLSAKEIADGALSSDPNVKLTSHECTDISILCHQQGMHLYGRQWMLEATARARQEKLPHHEIHAIGRKVAAAAAKNGNFYAANFLSSRKHKNRGDRRTALLDRRIQAQLKKFKDTQGTGEQNKMKKLAMTAWIPNMQDPKECSLCSYWKTGTLQDTRLSCRFEDNGHPLLKLKPMKYEEINRNPYMAVIHDAFDDRLVEELKTRAKYNLQRSTVGPRTPTETDQRISKRDLPSPKLRDQIEAMTTFKPVGENLQVTNYGIGGHYNLHPDPKMGAKNQRIATFMVYLSDFEGGATIFPAVSVSINPEKGKGVLWHNLEGDMESFNKKAYHSACPVIKGDKWIATFWIRQHGHEFTFPCSLTPPEKS